ncbi:mediator complex, subunit Med8 [Cadophora sp. MPI-SDFR-AT-0126]|nr:mediator complex, subunit Med8 [Leotiomycetes sp. MPI-SDFR-AT-0126]
MRCLESGLNSLQTSASILASNIESLASLLSTNSDLLSKTVVYPSTNYPGRTQEAVLTQLLRKKLEPGVETWVEEARTTQANAAEAGINEKDENALLEWVMDWMGPRIHKYVEEEDQGDYTLEERELGRENVNTGLRRKLAEDETDEEEDEEDEEMEDVGVTVTSVRRSSVGEVEFGLAEVKKIDPNAKMRNIEDILRFATTGVSTEQVGPRR